jgi:glycosyltransferase involved in cell wall biosynthesis
MKKPRILFVTASSGPSGSARSLLRTVRGLERRGYETVVAVVEGRGIFAELMAGEGGRVESLRGSSLGDGFFHLPGKFVRLLRIARHFKPEVIHGVFPQGNLLAKWAGFLKGIRNVSSIIDKTAFTEGRIVTIPNRIDLSEIPEKEEDDLFRFGVKEGFQILSCLGRLRKEKGFETILDIMPALADQFPRLALVVAGDGEERAALAERAKELGVAEKVRFTGNISDPYSLHLHSTIHLLPSIREVSPVPVLEAMACGVPVVASRIGAVPEILEEGREGILCEPGDTGALLQAVRMLLSDEGLRRAMGEMGREKVRRNFDIEKGLDRLEALYEGILPH